MITKPAITAPTAIQTFTGKRPIVMRSGLIHWLPEEKANEIEQMIQAQNSHSFITIRNQGITINTADIEGIYTLKEYDNICKMKQGMWQCSFQQWHKKGDQNCKCAAEQMRQIRQEQQRQKMEADNKPLTPAEQAERTEKLQTMTEEAALKGGEIFLGMFRPGGPRIMRRKTINAWERRYGAVKPSILEKIQIDDQMPKETDAVKASEETNQTQQAHEIFS